MNPIYKVFFGLHVSKCFILFFFLFLFTGKKLFAQPDLIRYNGSPAFCQGGSLILTAHPTGSSYVWQLNGTTVSTGSSYTVNQSGTVMVTVNGNFYSPLAIVVNPKPTLTFANNNNSPGASCIASYTLDWAMGKGLNW